MAYADHRKKWCPESLISFGFSRLTLNRLPVLFKRPTARGSQCLSHACWACWHPSPRIISVELETNLSVLHHAADFALYDASPSHLLTFLLDSLCCKCGAAMHSNPSNMCEACLTVECDIAADISKQHTITFCPKCSRFLNPPSQWIHAAWESPELLSLCLKRVKGLGNSTRLKEASFVFTEPHSRRIIIQIVVRGEIYGNTLVEQRAILYFTMQPSQCSECTRIAAKDYWNACVQIRQRVDHQRTLLYLEQILLRKNIQRHYSNVKQVKGGLDFFFPTRAKAAAFVEFVCKIIPCRLQTSQQLRSHDVHNNTYNYKFTFSLEVVPVCKDDVVCLPKAFAHRLGFTNQLLIVTKITNNIRLLDPVTCQTREVDVPTYFTSPFSAISNPRNCVEFFVMDVEEETDHKSSTPPFLRSSTSSSTRGRASTRAKPAGVWIVLSSHMADGESIYTRCHLGYVLKPGDTVLGLDLRNANINNVDYDKIPEGKRPDVILIKRLHATSDSPKLTKRQRRRTNSETTSQTPTMSELGDIKEGSSEDEEEGEDVADDVEYFDPEPGEDNEERQTGN
ncbi:hypothetical protein AAHC03_026837 [Spirometra sp. Aus1]